MGAHHQGEARRLRALALIGVALLSTSVLAGCANSARKVSQITTNAVSRDASRSLDTLSAPELQQAAQSTGQAYARDPKDRATAMRY
jgi:Flp pilus assembly protein TadD